MAALMLIDEHKETERRIEARSAEELPPEALCTHHFVPGLVETSHP